uniref:Suf domain-containing protein n=1 Tax=Steinernema glaseri TaxID=37863 RepID=A0A1I7YZQ0_9BILA
MRLPKKAAKVKNKAAAPVQITAEQLLREAKERELEITAPPPRIKITDPEELAEFNRKRRKEFEDNIRKNRLQLANWVKYAKWEESIGEVQRSRSIFERALEVDHRNITIWLQYAEMEMRNKQVNHARNIFDRAVTILPRATQFWLKYTYMEELIENVPGARQVFERWMAWEPDQQAWQTYINFELRYGEVERARRVWQNFLEVHSHDIRLWIRYARFEEKHGNEQNARIAYEQAMDYFQDDMDEKLLIAFAQFEERKKEHERARIIYKYALDHLPADKTAEVYKHYTAHEKKYGERIDVENAIVSKRRQQYEQHYTAHEKKYGERIDVENAIVSKRRQQYEQQISDNSYNYDAWFDYIRLLQSEQVSRDQMEDCYERAIANVPPYKEKRSWRRYIYLWINYALYEELEVKDIERTREVYKACLNLIPHASFTFAKIWVMFAEFEVRQLNLTSARKIMGTAIGKCPKAKLFKKYINLELQLREFDRCRTLYEKFVEFSPENVSTWIKFAELEALLGDVERARAIFDIAIHRPALDMPEVLWKAYIDFEIGQEEFDHVRSLYERLLERTNHIKVWISLADFEASIEEIEKARKVYSRANDALEKEDKTKRVMLLEAWKEFEQKHGDDASREAVAKQMPKKVKKRRPIQNEDGVDAGWEEYYEFVFPADQANTGQLKLFEAALRWKKQNQALPNDAEEPPEQADGEAGEPAQIERSTDSDTDLEESSDESSSSSASSSSSDSEDDMEED